MTESVPWVKWHFDKWMSDPGLRTCCLAARGLWMELLCIMHNATPYGHLAVKMKPLSERDVMQFVGSSSVKEIKKLMRELEDAGVFSRTSEGVIYCRRMVRDNDNREKSRVNGRKGGNPVLKNGHEGVNLFSRDGVGFPVKAEKEREKEKEKDSVLRTDAAASIFDVRTELWREGLTILRSLLGQPEHRSRAFLGKLLKASHDDCAQVLGILRDAESTRPLDPAAWLMKAAVPKAERDAPRITGIF
jgi:hypothetical protein